jgi:thiamine-monophosphate kinase
MKASERYMADTKKNIEWDLIRRVRRTFGRRVPGLVVGIGDDAAAVSGPGKKVTLYTADMLVSGVHFKKNEDYRLVGYKAIAVSVSDIAAMGGVPRYALVCVGLPRKGAGRVARPLIAGIRKGADKYGLAVIGGDMVRSPHVVVDVFMVGEADRDSLTTRSGARDGDHIFVTGSLGGSGKSRHLTFEPRLEESRFLVSRFKPTSMIDVSDGLAMDLNRIAAASNVGAIIFENKIPKNPGVRDTRRALCEGEDFELLFTVSPDTAMRLYEWGLKKKLPCRMTPIGKMTRLVRGVSMVKKDGRAAGVPPEGFQHYL